jgi:hypothetical protein
MAHSSWDTMYIWLYSPSDLGHFFSFYILYTVSRTPWMGDEPVARPLPTHRIETHRHPCLEVLFEPSTTVFESVKTVHASHLASGVNN